MVFIGVMIWILVLLLLAAGVGLGLRLGAICAAFSFVAIILATLFANLVGKMVHPLLPHLGVTDPIKLWAIPPIVGCLIVYILIMAGGIEVSRRVGVYYKYKAGDLRLALYERLNMRVGACLGVLTGAGWLVLVSFFIYNIGYWTTQVAGSEDEPAMIRLVNNLSNGLQSTGLDKAAHAVGSIPTWFYKTADFFGLLRQNPRLLARLGEYPAFISLTERPEIQQLVQNSSLAQSWGSGAPLNNILNDGQFQSIYNNTNLAGTIWGIVQNNMDDMTNYLITGKSPKYDSEKIIGRWDFDVVPALGALLEAQPKIKPNDLKAIRAVWTQAFASTTFVAGSDGQAFLKGVPDFKTTPVQTNTWTGQWSEDNANYDLTLSDSSSHTKVASAQTDGLRLTIKMGDNTYVFERGY